MTWLSLTPPLLVFALGFMTRRICFSLFMGVVLASCIAIISSPTVDASLYTLFETSKLIFSSIFHSLKTHKLLSLDTFHEAGNFFIIAFVFFLGILIEMIRQSRATEAFVSFAEKSIKDKRAAETSSLILSHCLCIDDYLSSLTVGSVMRHLTDRFKIPRVKLAFLTDSMAAPVAMITPVSSWAAAIIGFLMENGVHQETSTNTLVAANPYTVYLNTLPYIFYSSTLVLSVWFIVRRKISFGMMSEHEGIADETGNLAGGKDEINAMTQHENMHEGKASLFDFLLPLGTLLFATALLLLYLGDYALFGGKRSLVETLQNTSISQVLFFSGILALLTTTSFYLYRKLINLKTLWKIIRDGTSLMLPVAAILMLSWALGGLLREELHTGEWLASLIAGSIPVVLMPLILFWNATLISLALGSSWATAAILLPIAIPMVMSMLNVEAPATIDQLPIIFPICGAILSGAVCGDHISLISETTIMATTSTGCDVMDHVKTQAVYTIPVFIGSSLGFLTSGFFLDSSPWLCVTCCLAVSVCVSIGFLTLLHRTQQQKNRQISLETIVIE